MSEGSRSKMYERTSNSGHAVEWNPEDSDLAAEALANVEGTGVATKTEAKANAKVDLGEASETARAVRDEYQRLVEANTA